MYAAIQYIKQLALNIYNILMPSLEITVAEHVRPKVGTAAESTKHTI